MSAWLQIVEFENNEYVWYITQEEAEELAGTASVIQPNNIHYWGGRKSCRN